MACASVGALGLLAWAIGLLSWFGVLHYLESVLVKALAHLRSRLNLSVPNAMLRFERILAAGLLLALLLIVPALLVVLPWFFATRWHPSQLALHPAYAVYWLAIPACLLFVCLLVPRARRALNRFRVAEPEYTRLLAGSYLVVLIGLGAPFVALRLFGVILPLDFFLYVLMFFVVGFYAFAFGVLGSTVFLGAVAVAWVGIVSIYLVLRGLTRHPKGALETVSIVTGTVVVVVGYFGVCRG